MVIHPNSCKSTIHLHAAWIELFHWCVSLRLASCFNVRARREKSNCTTVGKRPCSNYITILTPLCCHCHLARTRTSGGHWAVYSTSCPQSPYIQMGRGHLKKDGLWLGYYYQGGGVQPLTGGYHQGAKWVMGRVEEDDPRCNVYKDNLTLRAGDEVLPWWNFTSRVENVQTAASEPRESKISVARKRPQENSLWQGGRD